LPFLLVVRILRHMLRQRRSIVQIATTLPLAALLATGWSFGELLGYVAAPAHDAALGTSRADAAQRVDRC
jgi:hypothetical protein